MSILPSISSHVHARTKISSIPAHTPKPRNFSSEKISNGKFLNYSMLYHDSVAFLLSNQLGIPIFLGGRNYSIAKPTAEQVANEFNLSVRAASALLVTLCRMDVVQIVQDNDGSVDEIIYELTPSAREFLSDRSSNSTFSPFADTLCTNFITPEALLESSRPEEKKDIMSQHLEQDDESEENNARHFMKHMNAQSYCCARAFPIVTKLTNAEVPTTILDIGGGSAIYTIEAVKSNPNVNGIVYELPAIKPITEEYIQNANLPDRITVRAGDFFTNESFLTDGSKVDLVLFSNILHDWPDEVNIKLIGKAYQCLNPGGKIVISELLLANDVKSSTESSTSMNIIMVPYTKGRQYRSKELFKRLEEAGFIKPCVKNLVDDYDLVIATKPH